MSSILITGGAGFIGSHLAEYLLAANHTVTVIDDLSTGKYSNITHLEARQGFRLIVASVLEERLMEQLIQSHDRVFHLASAVGVKLIMEQPVRTIQTIFNGTDVVLRYCSRYRKRVLITSTSEVYGKGSQIPFREEDDVLMGATSKHRWAYACAKGLDEFLALAHWREHALPVGIVRLFNTVGPRQTGQYGMVLPRFVEAAICGQPLLVFGDGRQTRCFTHVHDVVEGISKVLDTPGCLGKVINIGSDQEIGIHDLALRVLALTGSKSSVKFIPYEAAYGDGFEDMRRRVPCLARAGALIGYSPTRSLDTIIGDVVSDIKTRLGIDLDQSHATTSSMAQMPLHV